LCEVEAYTSSQSELFNYTKEEISEGSINILQYASSSQSSLNLDGESFRAIDGNKSQDFREKSCSFTGYGAQAWWTADLHESVLITTVKIWNREDLHSEYLTDYVIRIGNNDDYS